MQTHTKKRRKIVTKKPFTEAASEIKLHHFINCVKMKPKKFLSSYNRIKIIKFNEIRKK
jgi:hypothetical protein